MHYIFLFLQKWSIWTLTQSHHSEFHPSLQLQLSSPRLISIGSISIHEHILQDEGNICKLFHCNGSYEIKYSCIRSLKGMQIRQTSPCKTRRSWCENMVYVKILHWSKYAKHRVFTDHCKCKIQIVPLEGFTSEAHANDCCYAVTAVSALLQTAWASNSTSSSPLSTVESLK